MYSFLCIESNFSKAAVQNDAVSECLGSADRNNVPSCLNRILAVEIWDLDPLCRGWGDWLAKRLNWLAQIRAKSSNFYLSKESGFVY